MAMRIELAFLLITAALAGGVALVLLTGIAEKATKVSLFVWSILLASALLALVSFVAVYGGKVIMYKGTGSLLSLTVLLAATGFAAVRYGRRYDKRILGAYAVLPALAAAALLAVCLIAGVDQDRVDAVKATPFSVLHQMAVLAGISAAGVLCCLGFVAQRRPMKVRRFLRLTYLALGVALLSGAAASYQRMGKLWSWSVAEIQLLCSFLLVCALLHERHQYGAKLCLMPFGLLMLGMAASKGGLGTVSSVEEQVERSLFSYLLLLLFLLLIALLLMFQIRRHGMEKLRGEGFGPVRGIQIATVLYTAVLLASSIAQALSGANPFRALDITASALYGMGITALFIMEREEMPRLKAVGVVIWNTLAMLLVILLFPRLPTLALVLFWIYLFPVTFFLVQLKKYVKEERKTCHLLVSVLLLGIVASSGFRAEYECTDEEGSMQVAGRRIAAERLKDKEAVIVHKASGDYVVDGIYKEEAYGNGMVVTYHSKPLLYLVWISGIGILAYTVWNMAKRT